MAYKPGRATDAAVHRALFPKHEIGGGGVWELASRSNDYAKWSRVPAYTTSLAAWKGVAAGRRWWWEASQGDQQVQVYLRVYPYHGEYIYAEAQYADHNDRFEAQAAAMALCVLAWSERSGE